MWQRDECEMEIHDGCSNYPDEPNKKKMLQINAKKWL
jgi:hypothetical protein